MNGYSSSAQALSPVSKQSRIQSASSSSGHQEPSDHGGAYTFGEEGGNAFHSGSSDYNEDIMHFDFDSGDNGSNNNSQGGPSLDIDGINAADRETDAEDESDGSSEEDMDEFGDGVEPERVLDAQRPALPEVEPEEPPIPSSTNSNLPTSTHRLSLDDLVQDSLDHYHDTCRAFMTLVAALSSFFGLGRQAAGLLLVFFATVISPLLATPGSTPPRQLATVRKQLGLVPHLVHYVVCPACERLSLVADASEECQACGEILYERAGKPVILFVYQTLTSWLSWLLQQPGIEAALQEWRDEPPSTTMRDVYDGRHGSPSATSTVGHSPTTPSPFLRRSVSTASLLFALNIPRGTRQERS
ncbi:unnamed protein product [Tilletia controversa]|nr:unnamed protein product [Tilletia controversa]